MPPRGSFAENVGKTCIVVERDVAGFVTSRLLIAFVNEAIGLVEAGVATPSDIDLACTLGFGHAMGPFATLDLTGLDVIEHAAQVDLRRHRRCPIRAAGAAAAEGRRR